MKWIQRSLALALTSVFASAMTSVLASALIWVLISVLISTTAAKAEENPPPPLGGSIPAATAKSGPVIPAKVLFGKATTPAPLETRAIGFYSKGCLSGAQHLAVDGPAWQTMRLSRNRAWGHPNLIATVERLAADARAQDGWPGLLVGDMSQPRGGPMLTGHASHQIGLDADIWLTPMPNRRLTEQEREDLAATSTLAADSLSVNPKVWTAAHVKLLRRAASYPDVERVLVHPAIKKALCEATATEPSRPWLAKVRPYFGHFYHFHVRVGCPAGVSGCQAQAPIPADDGCGKELADWYVLLTAPPKPSGPPEPPKPAMTLDQMPPDCRAVLAAPAQR
jgi:penicillin-insensitive murein DD-endopeptidase